MKYSFLGNTNLSVSKIGFGAATLGEEYGAINPTEGERSVHYAIECGINYFDVAPYYGKNLAETRLGKALEGKRSEIILATKVGRYKKEDGEYFDFSAKGIRKSIEKSLKRLRTEYIDIYQLHDVEFSPRSLIIDEALPTMLQLKQEGKVGFVGITGYPLYVLKDIAMQCDIDVILSYSRYNLVDTSLIDILSDVIENKRIGLINASPLNMGLLTSKGPPDWHPVSGGVIEKVDLVRHYCDTNGINIEKVALQFALNNKLVDITLVGMSKIEHVIGNVKAMEDVMDSEILSNVLQIINPVKDSYWDEGIPENYDPRSISQ